MATGSAQLTAAIQQLSGWQGISPNAAPSGRKSLTTQTLTPLSKQDSVTITFDLTGDDAGNPPAAAFRGMDSTARSSRSIAFEQFFSKKRERTSAASPAPTSTHQRPRLSPMTMGHFPTVSLAAAPAALQHKGQQQPPSLAPEPSSTRSEKENQQPERPDLIKLAAGVDSGGNLQPLPPGVLCLGPVTTQTAEEARARSTGGAAPGSESTSGQLGVQEAQRGQHGGRSSEQPAVLGGVVGSEPPARGTAPPQDADAQQQPQQQGEQREALPPKAAGPQREPTLDHAGYVPPLAYPFRFLDPQQQAALQQHGMCGPSLSNLMAGGGFSLGVPPLLPGAFNGSFLGVTPAGGAVDLQWKLEDAQRQAQAATQALRTSVEETAAIRKKVQGLEARVAAAEKLAAEAQRQKEAAVADVKAVCKSTLAVEESAGKLQQEVFLLRRALVDADKRGARLEEVQKQQRALQKALDEANAKVSTSTRAQAAAQAAVACLTQSVGVWQGEALRLRSALADSEKRAAEGAATKKREEALLAKLDGLRAAADAAKAQAVAAKQAEAAARRETAEARRSTQAGAAPAPAAPPAAAQPAPPPAAADVDRTLSTLARIHLIQTFPLSIPGNLVPEAPQCYQLLCLVTGTPMGGQLTHKAARKALAELHSDRLGQLMGAVAAWGPHGQEQCRRLLTAAFQKINHAKEVLQKGGYVLK